MPEILTLTSAVTKPSTISWRIKSIFFDIDTPSIKVDLIANTGETETWRLIPSETVSAAEIKTGLLYIDDGKFKTVQNKSLRKWLYEQMVAKGFKIGSVTGTAD